jgi:Tol biopolymer transport system component
MRKLIALGAAALAVAAVVAIPASASPRGADGRIAYSREDPSLGDEWIYTANPDGSREQQLSTTPGEGPEWSPDGTLVKFNPHVEPDGSVAATIVNPDSGASRDLPNPDPTHFDGVFCGPWSPDGVLLACDGQAWSHDPTLNGIYTIRSSDGGGMQQVTSNPFGEDDPTDYSPNGKRLVMLRANFSDPDNIVFGFFTVKLDGTDIRRLTPPGMEMNFEPARWSPQGNEIVFSAHVPDGSHRSSLMIVHADGTGLHRLPVAGCGGAFSDPNSIGCAQPAWSPDGQKLIFTRFSAATGDRDVYTVNPDGSGLTQITNTPNGSEGLPNWGTHPLGR